jgi:hypothetical protein
MIKWFAADKWVLDRDETNIMKFIISNLLYCALSTGYKEKYIDEMVNTKFLALQNF